MWYLQKHKAAYQQQFLSASCYFERILYASKYRSVSAIHCMVNMTQQHKPAHFSTHIDYQHKCKDCGIWRHSWVLMNISPLDTSKKIQPNFKNLFCDSLHRTNEVFQNIPVKKRFHFNPFDINNPLWHFV